MKNLFKHICQIKCLVRLLFGILMFIHIGIVEGQNIDPNHYYRLTTQWQGDGKSLDIVNDGKNNKPVLAKTGAYTGQSWKLSPLGNGYYRLTTKWQGDGKSLDIINDGKNNRPILANTGAYKGQFWKLTKLHKVEENLGINMIIASDSQWAWTLKTDTGEKQSESDKEREATILNVNHVKSMNSLITSLNAKGVIINGDLTAFGHSKELNKFKDIYSKLKAPMYLGLGNHDYANNVDDTYENHAANRMVNYMVAHIKSNGSTNSDFRVSDSYEFPNIETTTYGSLSYSWDVGNVHFVQLQNYPIYKRSWSNYVSVGAAKRRTVKITPSLNWLERDLAMARRAGKIIVLNFHDSNGHWPDGYKSTELTNLYNEFKSMLSTYKVAAVFVGHYHGLLGKEIPSNNSTTYGSTLVFYCGSASQSKYLLANFKGNQMTVEHVSSLEGKAIKSNKSTYTVFDNAEVVEIPKKGGQVTFFNQSGYVARYTLSYMLDNNKKSFSTGNVALGNKRRYKIPAKATKIRVKGEGKTGLLWAPWRTTFNEIYSSPPNKCFKSYGTTLTQKWNNNCKL